MATNPRTELAKPRHSCLTGATELVVDGDLWHYLDLPSMESGNVCGVQPFTSLPLSCSALICRRTHGELRNDAADNHSSALLGAFGSRSPRLTMRLLPSQ
jgi:hypothetical protein